MPFTHRWKSGLNTVGASVEGYDGSAELWVESEDPLNTGMGVLKYLIQQGFTYGARYDVGNDADDNIILYQIDPPQLAAGSAVVWQVTLRYKLATPGMLGADGKPAAILNRPPSISTSQVTRSKPVQSGVYFGGLLTGWTVGESRPITNSAKTPYVPAPEIEIHNRMVRIVRNVAFVNMNTSAFPEKWINKESVLITNRKTTIPVLATTMKFAGWSTEEAFEEGVDFVRVTFEGEINPEGWRLSLMDQGVMADTCEQKPDGRYGSISNAPPGVPAVRNIVDFSGIPVSQSVILDGKGLPVDCPDKFFYGSWGVYNEIDIRTLPFFQGFTA